MRGRVVKVFQVQENCTAMACLITIDSMVRDSGGHQIKHLYNVYASSVSRRHSIAMDFLPCTRACSLQFYLVEWAPGPQLTTQPSPSIIMQAGTHL